MRRKLLGAVLVTLVAAFMGGLTGCGSGGGNSSGGLEANVAKSTGKEAKDCAKDAKASAADLPPGETAWICQVKDNDLGWVAAAVIVDKDGSVVQVMTP
jgi:hypothetical protein